MLERDRLLKLMGQSVDRYDRCLHLNVVVFLQKAGIIDFLFWQKKHFIRQTIDCVVFFNDPSIS
jgi:hypothetical protein